MLERDLKKYLAILADYEFEKAKKLPDDINGDEEMQKSINLLIEIGATEKANELITQYT